ncbi:MAG: tetratricopeptide repeat protein [Elusimicrobia bacterium]|nr:tetratricopeptide repeat protein [Elusimicrobiota bacterium]
MALKCPICGSDNPDDAACCGLCQVVLRREAPAAPAEPAPPAAPAEPAPRAPPAETPAVPPSGGAPSREGAAEAQPEAAPAPEAPAKRVEPVDFAARAEDLAGHLGEAGRGILLDYSAASLILLDDWLDGQWEKADARDPASKGRLDYHVWHVGCYAGEIACRAFEGAWQQNPEDCGQSIVAFAGAGGATVPPFLWVRNRLTAGGSRLWDRWQELRHTMLVTIPPVPEHGARDGEALGRQGASMLSAGKVEAALKVYRLGTELDARFAGCWAGLGECQSRLGRPSEALAALDKAVAADPRSAPYWSSRAGLLLAAGRKDEARESLARAADLDPKDASLCWRQADILRERRAWDESLKLYGRALELDAGCGQAFRGRGDCLAGMGRHEDAIKDYADYRTRTGDQTALLSVAFCEERLDRPAAAAEALAQFLKDPGKADPAKVAEAGRKLPVFEALAAAEAAAAAGKPSEVVEAYRKVLALDPSRKETKRRLGESLGAAKLFDEAIQVLDELLAADPLDSQTECSKGVVYAQAGRLDDARACFDRSLSLAPKDLRTQKRKAICLDQLKDDGALGRLCGELLAGDPACAEAWYLKGMAEKRAGRAAESLACFKKFLEHYRPDIPEAWRHAAGQEIWAIERPDLKPNPEAAKEWVVKALAFAKRQAFAEAAACYAKAIERDPLDADHRVGQSACLASLGRHEEALAGLAKALELNPASVPALSAQVSMLMSLKRWTQAVTALERLLARVPKEEKLWRDKAGCLYVLGRYDEAAKAWEEVARLLPGNRMLVMVRALCLDRAGRTDEAVALMSEAFLDRAFREQFKKTAKVEIGPYLEKASPAINELMRYL